RRALYETVASIRRLAAELRLPTLDDFGFLAALETDIRSFEERTGIECDLSLPSTPVLLPPETETAAYRIVQEALTNVARHANASRVEIRLRIRDHEVLLDVRDDGRGLNGAGLCRRGRRPVAGRRRRRAHPRPQPSRPARPRPAHADPVLPSRPPRAHPQRESRDQLPRAPDEGGSGRLHRQGLRARRARGGNPGR